MNKLKRYLGVLWMIIGPAAIYYLIKTASEEIAKNPVINTKMQWIVFVVIFIPIAIGIMIFGWFALKGDYDHLPESSAEVED